MQVTLNRKDIRIRPDATRAIHTIKAVLTVSEAEASVNVQALQHSLKNSRQPANRSRIHPFPRPGMCE